MCDVRSEFERLDAFALIWGFASIGESGNGITQPLCGLQTGDPRRAEYKVNFTPASCGDKPLRNARVSR